jgi:hypothetical protein
MRLFAPLALSFAVLSTPVLADTVVGEVLTFDPATQVLVLDDKSSWSLKDGGIAAPDGLAAGQTVTIDFNTNGDNGFGKINSIIIQ